MRGVICVELVASRSMQQYNNSYKELFSQIKIARELRGFGLIRGKITMSPPQSNKESHMHLPPMKPPPPTPLPPSPPSPRPPPSTPIN
ncbi:hypothetical protein H5410_020030 [Solanum commersonii]|uniref:Uncharacterized protein n=1 Tax=Solanum commersonii TaxID=4109 RepID=A0A9J5Z8Z8_SOLCO|nr:hypothetical protein H5410_020030 [Solanum commersonii]